MWVVDLLMEREREILFIQSVSDYQTIPLI